MQLSLTTLALLVVSASATLKKANEYKSGDCSGDLNFGHKSGNLGDVTMDDSTHSVYLATQEGDDTWEGWSGKTKNGGGCTGEKLGLVPHLECLNLDTTTTQRIQCVRYVSQGGCKTGIGPECGSEKPPVMTPFIPVPVSPSPKLKEKRSVKFRLSE